MPTLGAPYGYGSPLNYGGYTYPRRYYGGYGSSYGYGRRNYGYGNQNNSMYFSQMRRLSRLINDLNNLTRGSTAAPIMVSRLRSDLMGVVMNNYRPAPQAVQQLATDLATVLPTRSVPLMQTGQLARDLMVVMNASGQNAGQAQNAIGSAQSVMSMSGVPQQGIQRISSDLMAVAMRGNMGNALTQLR